MRSPLNFGTELTELLELLSDSPLDAGQPRVELQPRLLALEVEPGKLASRSVVNAAAARACLAGLWLRLNELDKSHRISQELPSTAGSYWHAIMHRREGDFGNSKYWFRQVGNYPTFGPLLNAARQVTAEESLTQESLPEPCHAFVALPTWDPYRFVDLCEAVVRRRLAAERWCRRVQQFEWQLLFEDCFCQAVSHA